MKIKYYDFEEIDIPDDKIEAILEPNQTERPIPKETIEEVLLKELSNTTFFDQLKSSKNLLILSDDITRQTPVDLVIPTILNLANKAGISDDNITILVALGTHRAMSEAELEKKFGKEVSKRIKIKFHDYRKDTVNIGKTEGGTDIVINKLLLEHDFVMGMGMIVPHRVAGFSGGGKIVQPGVSGEITTGETHWLSARFKGEEILGKVENPVRKEIDSVAINAGLKFIVNFVLDKKGKPLKIFAGDPIEAFRRGAEFSKATYGVQVKKKAKIIITDSYPADLEMWQAAKGIYSAGPILEDNGVLILVTPCPEGISVEFKEIIEKFGYLRYEKVKRLVETGELNNLIVAAHLVHVGEVIEEKGKCILVSPGIDDEIAKKIGFIPAKSLKDAIELAESLVGNVGITICKNGGELLAEVM